MGYCGVKQDRKRKESSGCDGEKSEKEIGERERRVCERKQVFSSGARQCKWPVSGSQRAVQRPLLISRGSNMVDLTS